MDEHTIDFDKKMAITWAYYTVLIFRFNETGEMDFAIFLDLEHTSGTTVGFLKDYAHAINVRNGESACQDCQQLAAPEKGQGEPPTGAPTESTAANET